MIVIIEKIGEGGKPYEQREKRREKRGEINFRGFLRGGKGRMEYEEFCHTLDKCTASSRVDVYCRIA
jgi:hypothetical protein